MSYEAVIVRLPSGIKVPKADRLQVFNVLGYPVITDLSAKEGDVGILFTPGTALSEEFARENNLHRHPELNKDPSKVGFFEDNRKVRAQKFKGISSEGLYMPLESLSWTGHNLSTLKEGDQFKALSGKTICDRFYCRHAQKLIGEKKDKKNRKKDLPKKDFSLFAKHFETGQLRLNVQRIKEGDLCIVSEKTHGCISAETIIDTLEHGSLPIKQIVDNKLDVRVKAFNLQTQEVTYEPISNWYLLPNHGDWLEVELEDGTKLEVTTNNSIWLPEFKVYRRADELKTGDSILFDE